MIPTQEGMLNWVIEGRRTRTSAESLDSNVPKPVLYLDFVVKEPINYLSVWMNWSWISITCTKDPDE